MTPRLRTLFDDKVEPLLEVVRYREELAAKEKGRATHSRRVENAEESLQSLQARLEAATAAQQTGGQGQKEGGDGDGDEENGGADTDGEMDPKALAQQQRLKDAIAQAQRMKNKYQRKLEKLQKASTKLRGKVRSVLKRQAVGPVLAALEASVIDGGEDQGAEADSSDSSDSDDDKPIAALAASARAKASASAASASASPAPPKKKAKGKATTHKQSGSLLARFLLEQRDPGSCVLGFVGGSSALTGIGATARGVRKAVKASLPHLAVHYIRSKGMPAITAFPRLRHLALDGAHYRRLGAWPKDLLVLNDNLETLRIHSEDERILQPLVIVLWPELRVLEMADLGQFLDAVLARPAVVFPRLLSLAASRLDGQTSRKLLQLLDRGAFPALAALVPCEVGVEQPIQIAPTTSNDMAQLCAVVDRLAVGDSLCLNDYSLDADTSWESFAARIVSGRLAQLKCVRGSCFRFRFHKSLIRTAIPPPTKPQALDHHRWPEPLRPRHLLPPRCLGQRRPGPTPVAHPRAAPLYDSPAQRPRRGDLPAQRAPQPRPLARRGAGPQRPPRWPAGRRGPPPRDARHHGLGGSGRSDTAPRGGKLPLAPLPPDPVPTIRGQLVGGVARRP